MAQLLFLDESGQDHHESPYEVLGGIAVEDSRIWPLITDVQAAEVEHFGGRVSGDELELKAKKLLKRKTFRLAAQLAPYAPEIRKQLAAEALDEGARARKEDRPSRHTRAQLTALAQAKIAFCGKLLELSAKHQGKAFASIVLPRAPRPAGDGLRKDYSYLFERFFLLLRDEPLHVHGIVVFDELERSQSHILIRQMADYFVGTATGRLRASRVLPEPMFVHSHLTTLVQLADLIVYIISWAVRIKGMIAPERDELAELAESVRHLRYRTTVENQDGEFERWSFVYIDDLRPRREKDGSGQ